MPTNKPILEYIIGIRFLQDGDGVITLLELQRAGGKRLPAREFLQGFALTPGLVFGAPTTRKRSVPGAAAFTASWRLVVA